MFRYRSSRRQILGSLNSLSQIFGRGALCLLLKIDFLGFLRPCERDLGVFWGGVPRP